MKRGMIPGMDRKGFSVTEMLVTLAIFSVIMAAVSGVYVVQTRQTATEFSLGGSEVELQIAKGIIERDLKMAGYGLADNYGTTGFAPRAAAATNGTPDTLVLMGTALGIEARSAQGWTYIDNAAPTFAVWGDVREDIDDNDSVILIEPATRTLIGQNVGGVFEWQFRYVEAVPTVNSMPSDTVLGSPAVGTLIYGLDSSATRPFAAVTYSLGGAPPSICAPGANNLLRAESWTATPGAGTGNALLACVRDFQIAFGLDANEDGTIDTWDNGGAVTAGFTIEQLKNRLRQIRMYLLVQSGHWDPDYTFPQGNIWVGDAALGIGQNVSLAGVRNYRWRLVTVSAVPRNVK